MTDAGRTAAGATRTAVRGARWVIAYELGLWRSLFRWVLRRPVAGRGEHAFGYAGLLTPVFVAFIVVSAIEIPIVHLILPWSRRARSRWRSGCTACSGCSGCWPPSGSIRTWSATPAYACATACRSPLRLSRGRTERVAEVRFSVDDPDALLARARERLVAAPPIGG
jgi:hypothetical protein